MLLFSISPVRESKHGHNLFRERPERDAVHVLSTKKTQDFTKAFFETRSLKLLCFDHISPICFVRVESLQEIFWSRPKAYIVEHPPPDDLHYLGAAGNAPILDA